MRWRWFVTAAAAIIVSGSAVGLATAKQVSRPAVTAPAQSSPAADAPDSGKGVEKADSSADPEAGKAGEPAKGHEDTSANAAHECTGNCAE